MLFCFDETFNYDSASIKKKKKKKRAITKIVSKKCVTILDCAIFVS